MDEIENGNNRKKVILCLVSIFVTAFMGSALNPAIPALSKEFQLTSAGAGWVVTAYMLTCTVLPVPIGRFAHIVDNKKIL